MLRQTNPPGLIRTRLELRRPLFALCIAAGLSCSFTGCADSDAYHEYSELPGPPAERHSDVDGTPGNGTDVAREDVVAGSDQSPPGSQPSDKAEETVATTQQPHNAAPVESGANSAAIKETTDDSVTGSASVDDTSAGDQAAVAPRKIKLLVPHKTFRQDRSTNAIRVSYDDLDLLKVLNMEPVPVGAEQHFPQWLRDLDGQRIVIRGFMFPTFVVEGVTDFGLARDNGICCFVNEPKAYDMIDVHMADGKSTNYIQGRPFDVTGVLRIAPEAKDEAELLSVYRIEDADVVQ